MKIIYAQEPILNFENSIFLAGPTLRVNSETVFDSTESWRNEAIKILESKNFQGTVFIPEFRDNKLPEDHTYSRQVSWEKKGLEGSSVILFWIARDKEKLPAFTTNIEFGLYFKSGKIVVGFPKNSYKNQYIQEICSQEGIHVNETLDATIEQALSFNKKDKTKYFFTSDTHFSEPRTMQLSKRPFENIEDHDWTMISNWNKNITNNDIVYHLGDWGNPKHIKHLNGKEIYIIKGNYDKIEVLDELVSEKKDRVHLLPEGHEIELNNQKYSLVHYPNSMTDPNKFYLFGHIHKTQMCKHQGLNVGVDCHNYTPIDLETVEFYRTAILHHYDQNVFSDVFTDCINNGMK